MNKILVLFDSKTGNVAKMAALVAEGALQVSDTEVRVRSVDEATADDVIWCDGLAVGSPTNMGILSWKMKRFWDETMFSSWMQVDGKIACAFSSAGGWGGGMEINAPASRLKKSCRGVKSEFYPSNAPASRLKKSCRE